MSKVLVVCDFNMHRSPAVASYLERVVYSAEDTVRSAGLYLGYAEQRVSRLLVQWAEVVYVMEERHERKLRERYGLQEQRVVTLGIRKSPWYLSRKTLEAVIERCIGGGKDGRDSAYARGAAV